MGKKRNRTPYTSKGTGRNVSRKTLNLMRAERMANPSAENIILRERAMSPENKSIQKRASELFKKYESRGVKWSACIQAVKTNWIPQFETKWAAR